MALTSQPQSMSMVTAPTLTDSLKHFATLDEVIVDKVLDMVEYLCGAFIAEKKFVIQDKNLQQVFSVNEDSDLKERYCCPNGRGFQLHVVDNESKECMKFSREYNGCVGCWSGIVSPCCCCGAGCCQQAIQVELSVGNVIGKIMTERGICQHHIKLYDKSDTPVYTMWATCCPCQGPCCCTGDIDFQITDPVCTHRVANIAKEWTGCVSFIKRGVKYKLNFPHNLSIDHKALMVGAVFMVEQLIVAPFNRRL